MHCIAQAKNSPIGVFQGVHAVYRPGRCRVNFDWNIAITNQLMQHLFCIVFSNIRFTFVNIVAPDTQPFIPGANHPNQGNAESGQFPPWLNYPVQDARAMGDIFS